MIKVLHLITGLETGGAERMLVRLVARMNRQMFESIVVTMTDRGQLAQEVVDAGIRLYSLDLRRGVPDPRGVFRLARISREFRPDIHQTWLYHADFLGLITWRLGLTQRLLWNIRCTELTSNTVLRRLLAHWSPIPDAIVVNSQAGERFHEKSGYRPRRWAYIPNGFDTTALRPDAELGRRQRASLGISEKAFVILMPARHHPMKDHATFFRAAREIAADPNVCFLLAGSGVEPGNHDLYDAVKACGLADRTFLLGERRDIDALYAAADVVTLSSAFGEGFPNVLGEAMCCGVPCVATDVGDVSEIIGNAGFVVGSRDPMALAAAWRRIAAMSAGERETLGAAARARAETFSLGEIVGQYEALYQDVLNSAPGSAPSAH